MDCGEIAENCRACQIKPSEESPKIFIFNTVQLPDIFMETTSLNIHENDGLPKVLCSTCYDRLLEAYNFRKMCSAAVLYFEKILSMDVPEAKYTPPEHLSDPLMATKPDPDDLDSLNYLPEKKYTPPEEKFNLPEVPFQMTTDEKPLVGQDNVADDNLLIPRNINKKTRKRREKSTKSSKNKTSNQPVDTKKPAKREERKNLSLECHLCKAKFVRKGRLEMHMMVKHQGLKVCECKICGQRFTRPDSLKGHMGTLHGIKRKYPCSEPGCTKHYETEEGLQKHMKIWHDPENPKIRIPNNRTWVCEVCGKEFKVSGALKEHSYTHGITKPFACMQCNKRFPTGAMLKIHIKRHEGIKNHVCKICGLKKVTARELKTHLNTHTKEKTWPCKFCPGIFTQQENMKMHVKVVHQGVKDFHCPHCEKSFGKAETLKHHVMTHTGEKPHACSECGKRFIQPVALKTHMKTHLKYK